MAVLSPLGWVALSMLAGGAILSGIGFLKSGVGLSPIAAYSAGIDVEGNTVAAQRSARRRRWAVLGAIGFVMSLAGGFLLNAVG
ncbi:MAG TPA: hypothetical protein VM286_09845 [Candidatus Thermoplasmatota archaeon]|nr:hypothetical protein [Candidatus Thermoplasmatota archaeon]